MGGRLKCESKCVESLHSRSAEPPRPLSLLVFRESWQPLGAFFSGQRKCAAMMKTAYVSRRTGIEVLTRGFE